MYGPWAHTPRQEEIRTDDNTEISTAAAVATHNYEIKSHDIEPHATPSAPASRLMANHFNTRLDAVVTGNAMPAVSDPSPVIKCGTPTRWVKGRGDHHRFCSRLFFSVSCPSFV